MLSFDAACFIKVFVNEIDKSIKSLNHQAQLSNTQKTWLSFCLTGILVSYSNFGVNKKNAVNCLIFDRHSSP